MANAAANSSRANLILDPYPSIVDPDNPHRLAMDPKVQCMKWGVIDSGMLLNLNLHHVGKGIQCCYTRAEWSCQVSRKLSGMFIVHVRGCISLMLYREVVHLILSKNWMLTTSYAFHLCNGTWHSFLCMLCDFYSKHIGSLPHVVLTLCYFLKAEWVCICLHTRIHPIMTFSHFQQLKSMQTKYQFILLSSPPSKEAAFQQAKARHGSVFAFQYALQ